MEVWRNIPEYVGFYEVSNHGNVRSVSRLVKCRGGKSRLIIGKNLSLSIGTNGYLKVTLSKKGQTKTHYIHILVAICFLNHKPNGYDIIVDHKDNIKTNNYSYNLQLITQRENLNKDKKTLSGVYFDKTRGNYQSRIRVGGKRLFLGTFKSAEQAHNVYLEKLKEI